MWEGHPNPGDDRSRIASVRVRHPDRAACVRVGKQHGRPRRPFVWSRFVGDVRHSPAARVPPGEGHTICSGHLSNNAAGADQPQPRSVDHPDETAVRVPVQLLREVCGCEPGLRLSGRDVADAERNFVREREPGAVPRPPRQPVPEIIQSGDRGRRVGHEPPRVARASGDPQSAQLFRSADEGEPRRPSG